MDKFKSALTIAFSVLFTSLFYDKLIGLNLLLFEGALIAIAYIIHKPSFKGLLMKIVSLGTLISLAMVVIHNSSFAIILNMISFFCLMGAFTFSKYSLITNQFRQYFISVQYGITDFFSSLFSKKRRSTRIFTYFNIILIPIAVILVFLLIYYNSNSYFAELTDSFFNGLSSCLLYTSDAADD